MNRPTRITLMASFLCAGLGLAAAEAPSKGIKRNRADEESFNCAVLKEAAKYIRKDTLAVGFASQPLLFGDLKQSYCAELAHRTKEEQETLYAKSCFHKIEDEFRAAKAQELLTQIKGFTRDLAKIVGSYVATPISAKKKKAAHQRATSIIRLAIKLNWTLKK